MPTLRSPFRWWRGRHRRRRAYRDTVAGLETFDDLASRSSVFYVLVEDELAAVWRGTAPVTPDL